MQIEINFEKVLGEKQKDLTEKQKAIIKAACLLFAQKGYTATSTREIAQLAQVAEGTIFKNYATKDELFLAITDLVIENIIEPFFMTGLEEIFAQTYNSLEEVLQAIITNRIQLMQSEELPVAAIKLIVQELPYRPQLQSKVAAMLEKLPLQEILKNLQEQGKLIDWPLDVMQKLIMSSIVGFLITKIVMLPQFFAHELPDYTQYWIHFIAGGLSKQGDGEKCEN